VRLASRVWTTGQTLTADAEIAHFGPAAIRDATPVWRIERDNGAILARGELPSRDIPVGNGTSLGQISVDLRAMPAPASLRLVLGLRGSDVENAWNVWLYDEPNDETLPDAVRVAGEFGAAEQAFVEAGGRLLLLPKPAGLAGRHPHGSFIPVFWNRLLMKDQPGQTLGLLCDRGHAALAAFPTERHADWQWEDLCDRSRYLVLDALPPALRPIVQPIDDWNTNRRLGLVFECEVGRGRVVVCSADLSTDLAARPATRQLRRSLTAYLASGVFAPAVRVDAGVLADLVRPSSTGVERATFDPSMVPMTEGEA
jgi:hypothetical protein